MPTTPATNDLRGLPCGYPITWQCVKNLYHHLCTVVENPCGLTKEHVYLPGFLKMRVHLATQIFSPKVLAGLKSSNLANVEEIKYLEIGERIRNLLLVRTSVFKRENYQKKLADLSFIIDYFTEWINDETIITTMTEEALKELEAAVICELKVKMSKNSKKKTPTQDDIGKALNKKKNELIQSTRLHPTFLKHFVIYLNGSRHAIIAFMHRYGAREQLYFYHALRNTQSPLECYYSRLRGMDSNTRISGSNITEKQAGVSLHASMKKGSSALVQGEIITP